MIDIIASQYGKNCIGRLGENERTRMLFDITDYLSEFPDATFLLLNRTPGQTDAYPVAEITTDEQHLYWTVANSALTQKGIGQCELVVQVGGMVAKSVIFTTEVLDALDGSGDVPSPWQSWLTLFEEYASSASRYAEQSEESASAAAYSAEQAAERAYGISVNGNILVFTPPEEQEG